MSEYISAGKMVIDAIISENWIIDVLNILKMYKQGKYYSQSVNVAYIVALFIINSSYKKEISNEYAEEMVKAALTMNIGVIVTKSDDEKSQIEETIDFLKSRTDNKNILEMVENHLEKEDGSGVYQKTGKKLSLGSKIIIAAQGVERLLLFLNMYSFDEEKISEQYMERERFIINMNTKYDKEIVEAWKEGMLFFLPEVEKIKYNLLRYSKINMPKQVSMQVTPIQMVIDAILKNIWIRDFMIKMKEREDQFLYTHSLNTAIHTATIILMGNNESITKGKFDIHDIVIGSILHDVGYLERETINHTYHLCIDLSGMEVNACKWHIIKGIELVEEYFKDHLIHDKDIILDIIENHHEYEDGTGYYGRMVKNAAVKIVNLANAIDLQMYKAYSKNEKIQFIQNDSKYQIISQKFDTKIINNVLGYALNILTNISKVVNQEE